jgi:peptide chain release factor subunit 1
MITRETLSDLMSFNPEHYLTTTLYLAIDGIPGPNYAIEVKDLIKQRQKEIKEQELSPEVRRSLNSDLRKIRDYVQLKFQRNGVRTLILISCSAKKYWKVLTVQMPLQSQLIIGSKPYVRPLSLLLDEYRRFLVILVERAKARLFEVYAGEIDEYTDVLDDVPGKVKMGGYGGYEERRIERHIEDHVRRHFKRVADVAFELSKRNSHDAVILLGSEQNTNEFRHYLHITLQDRIAATAVEEFTVNVKDVLERVTRLDREIKDRDDQLLLERLFNQVNSGGLGIVGLDSTIRALQQGQVNFLVVEEGYEKDGYRCIECRSLSTRNGACDYCGGKTQLIPDIIEEAVQECITQGCQVKYINLTGSELTNAGKIGAMLRFKTQDKRSPA